jgi:Holliday junction resolvase RusA-like endonuclease
MTRFVVLGLPATKGSTVSFLDQRGQVVTKADCKTLAQWTQAVGWAARGAGIVLFPPETPVHVRADFQFTRPKSTKRVLPTVKPDLDKLARALLDALIGVAFVDDGQVTALTVAKRYADEAQTVVIVQEG